MSFGKKLFNINIFWQNIVQYQYLLENNCSISISFGRQLFNINIFWKKIVQYQYLLEKNWLQSAMQNVKNDQEKRFMTSMISESDDERKKNTIGPAKVNYIIGQNLLKNRFGKENDTRSRKKTI